MNNISFEKQEARISESPTGYFAAVLILFGLNTMLNFLRPLTNLYIMYIEINWAEFQFLEVFDILNMLFGVLLIFFGFLIILSKKFSSYLLIYGGFLFFLFNLLDPSHFFTFSILILILMGTPPVWIQVIPDNLLGLYLAPWSILSISHILLTLIGMYIAIRILTNNTPQRALFQYIFFYCIVSGITGFTLLLQSLILTTITTTWSSVNIGSYTIRLGTWIFMSCFGITGTIFVKRWLKNQLKETDLRIGKIALISFVIMNLLISFSDFAMKTYFSLLLNSIIGFILILFALKLPRYLKVEK
ncbi:MAG: hypothetical protein ACTSYB_18430 [Candidatus Helarchaeota archaeon]